MNQSILIFVLCSVFQNVYACETTEIAGCTLKNTPDQHFSIISIVNHNEGEWISQIHRVRDIAGKPVYSFSLPSSVPVPNTLMLRGERHDIELACMSSAIGLRFVSQELEIKSDEHYYVFCDGTAESPSFMSKKQ